MNAEEKIECPVCGELYDTQQEVEECTHPRRQEPWPPKIDTK